MDNNDDIFEEEVDEEAAAERARAKAEAERRAQATQSYTDNQNNWNQQQSQQNQQGASYGSYTYNGPTYSGTTYSNGQGRPGYNESGKKVGTGMAVASMILGILSLTLFCTCINPVVSILAIIFGIVYLRSYDLSQGKGMAIAGIICGGIAVLLAIIATVAIVMNSNLENLANDDDLFNFYFDYDTDQDGDDSLDEKSIEEYLDEFYNDNDLGEDTFPFTEYHDDKGDTL